jgi:hypothetical protein
MHSFMPSSKVAFKKIKVKLSLCLIKSHAMKKYVEGVEV